MLESINFKRSKFFLANWYLHEYELGIKNKVKQNSNKLCEIDKYQ